jgi:hypothetical protein
MVCWRIIRCEYLGEDKIKMRLPRLTAWTIRAALIYLFLGFSIGSILLIHKGIYLHPRIWAILPAHINFLLYGWMGQLIMGIVFWIFPRYGRTPKRGKVKIAWSAVILLNIGVWTRTVEPFTTQSALIGVLGRSTLLASGLAFGLYAWGRVKSFGS